MQKCREKTAVETIMEGDSLVDDLEEDSEADDDAKNVVIPEGYGIFILYYCKIIKDRIIFNFSELIDHIFFLRNVWSLTVENRLPQLLVDCQFLRTFGVKTQTRYAK